MNFKLFQTEAGIKILKAGELKKMPMLEKKQFIII